MRNLEICQTIPQEWNKQNPHCEKICKRNNVSSTNKFKRKKKKRNLQNKERCINLIVMCGPYMDPDQNKQTKRIMKSVLNQKCDNYWVFGDTKKSLLMSQVCQGY